MIQSISVDEKVAISVIAAIAAVLAALIGLVSAFVAVRLSGKTAKTLELLRQQFKEREGSQLFSDASLQDTLRALKVSLGAIQGVKDEVLLILNSLEGSLDKNEAVQRLTTARDAVFATFKNYHGLLDKDDELDTFHTAKTLTLTIYNSLTEYISEFGDPGLIPGEYREVLWRLRAELTDCQQKLRDSRSDRIMVRVGE